MNWEVTDDGGRMPDDPAHKCVFVDMRPDDFRALLHKAADALEEARDDVERWRFVREQSPATIRLDGNMRGSGLPDGLMPSYYRANTAEELDAAIDQARGKGVAGE